MEPTVEQLKQTVQELERIVQNLQQRFGQRVAEYETNIAVLVTRLQGAEEAQQQATAEDAS